jgi:hypothetical protein
MTMRNSCARAAFAASLAALAASIFAFAGDLYAQSGPAGQAEFYKPGSNSFTVPEGVTRIRVFVYGAGGGAGSSISSNQLGLNGGSGAFVQAVIDVTAGEKLSIVVGAGGAGGKAGVDGAGKAGGASEILSASKAVLVSAGGGGAGTGCEGCSSSVHVGAGGMPGKAPTGSLLHPGPDGTECGGGSTRCGYTPPGFTADVDFGGRGFNNGNVDETETIDGIAGYVYFEW